MTLHELSATLKDSARRKLLGNYSNSVFMTFIYYLMVFLANFAVTMPVSFIATFASIMSGSTTLGPGYTIAVYLLTTVASLFLGVLNTGISLFFLNLACGRTATSADLFYGYRFLFKKSLAISAVNLLVSAIPLLPYNICYYMFETTLSTDWATWTIISCLGGTLLYLPFSLAISQTFFLLLDFPQRSVKELLSHSIRLMKGRKWKYLYIQLSFLPLMLLSLLTMGIGNLWLTPYINMTCVLFFLDIMKAGSQQDQCH